jgi:uncharacterized membrane protein
MGLIGDSPLRQIVLLIAMSGMLAIAPARAAAADPDTNIDVRASKEGDIIVVDVALTISASQHEVWNVLTDYDHMADFISDLQSSSVISRTGDTLDVMQKGTVRYGLLSFPFETVRRVMLTPRREIRSRIMSGDMTGSEIVTRITADGPITQVSVRSRYVPTIWIPPVIGTSVIAAQTRQQWLTLREEVLRRRAAMASPSAGL